MASLNILSDINTSDTHQTISNKLKKQSSPFPSRPFFNNNVIALLISGHISAFIGGIIAFPFEKVLLRHSVGHNEYKNMTTGLKYIYKTEGGFIGFYRGLTLRFARISIATVPLIVSDEIFRRFFVSPHQSLDIKGELLCGALSGICATGIHAPFDRARLRMQTSLHAGEYHKSVLRNIKTYVTSGGNCFDFYKGSSGLMFGNITYAMILFPTFAMFKHYNILNRKQDLKSDLTYSGIACGLAMIGRRIVSNITGVWKDIRTATYDHDKRMWNSRELQKHALRKLVNLQRIIPSTMLQLPLISISLSVIELQKRQYGFGYIQ
eukprot:270416_1